MPSRIIVDLDKMGLPKVIRLVELLGEEAEAFKIHSMADDLADCPGVFLCYNFPMANFTRTIENFICDHCGTQVKGNGYTNHCPRCLWSKHVDASPGDRANPCQGLMQPVAVEIEQGEYILTHQCQKCGEKKRNKADKEDDFEDILKLVPTAM